MKKKNIIISSIFAAILIMSMPIVTNVQAQEVKNNIEQTTTMAPVKKFDIKNLDLSSCDILKNFEKMIDGSDDIKPAGPFRDIIEEIINLILAIIQKIGENLAEQVYGLIIGTILAIGWIVLVITVVVLTVIDIILSVPYNILVMIRDFLQDIFDRIPDML